MPARAVARLLILNTPQNPTGKVFHEDELLEMVKVLHDFPRVRAPSPPPSLTPSTCAWAVP